MQNAFTISSEEITLKQRQEIATSVLGFELTNQRLGFWGGAKMLACIYYTD